MLQEQWCLTCSRPDARPNWIAGTFVAKPLPGQSPEAVLSRIREVWEGVARWGHWWEADQVAYPSLEAFRSGLPGWFLDSATEPEISWMHEFLQDRDWSWWSGTAFADFIKIDIAMDGYPTAYGVLTMVVEKSGGTLSGLDQWVDSAGAARRFAEAFRSSAP